MFPQLGATAESLSKASSLVLRIGTDAHLYDDPDDVSIAPLLDSRFDSEKIDALKRLLALIAQGADVSHFFPQVVKNVASHSLEVKKLVYLYLLHYAEKRQNEALLSINCFQKDLSDTNPLVRAWALRAMTSIRLHVVAPLLLAAITKCARDPSIYVRKCAAFALPKLYDLNREESSDLIQLVDILLGDNSPGVIGAASVAFNSICLDNLALISKHFQRLCETLPDIEEWSQIVLIEILLRHTVARHGLVRESVLFADVGGDSDLTKNYVKGEGEGEGGLSLTSARGNGDVELLLRCTAPLLWSKNSGVVLAAAGVHWIMSPSDLVKRIVKPVLFLLRSSTVAKYVVLCNILVFAKAAPSLFAPYYEDFFISGSDPYQTRTIKLEILSTIATESSIPSIFEEFQDYIKDPDRRFVACTVSAIGLCAKKIHNLSGTCLEGLLSLVLSESSISSSFHFDGEESVLVQAILSIKTIIKQDPSANEKVIVRLVRNLDKIPVPTARALIIWIFGEYNSIGKIIPKITPTVLKYLAWSFTSEEFESKLQILNSCAKVVINTKGEDLTTFRKILDFILQLAKSDSNYDVRDRARFLSNLLSSKVSDIHRDLIEKILSGKALPQSQSYPSTNFRVFLPGSLSQVVLHTAPGYSPLPKPGSMLNNINNNNNNHVNTLDNDFRNRDYENNRSDLSSGSEMDESGSVYESEDYSDSEGTSQNEDNYEEAPLVEISETKRVDRGQTSRDVKENLSNFISTDLTEMMSRSALESWLDEKPDFSSNLKNNNNKNKNTNNLVQESSCARISFMDRNFELKPRKIHDLLDPANCDGLRVQYAFSLEVSTVSPIFVCVELFFENCSSEMMRNIDVKYEESSRSSEPLDQVLEDTTSILNMDDSEMVQQIEEISSLSPNERVRRVAQVNFKHHLLPLKLNVLCNVKKYVGKLWPDIAYFLRPVSFDLNSFLDLERQLPGMFECSRRCTFKDHLQELEQNEKNSIETDKNLVVAHGIASKMLSSANIYLVCMDMPVSLKTDDVSGLCLRFCGEILSSSKPCLVTLVAHGNLSGPLDVSVKVNCEDTVFGLNLLNRIVAILQ